MGYNQNIIEEIKGKADIVEVIGSYMSLSRSGANFKGLCPFHDDRNPSMIVSPAKQIYKCFVCGAGGNVITFVKDYAKINFNEAIEILAKRYNITIERNEYKQDDKKKNLRENVIKAYKSTADYYYNNLYSASGANALTYLHNRGITDEIIKEFSIGYSPDGWDNTINTLTKQNFEIQTLLDAKLAIQKETNKRPFDMFRNRIMFPITDFMGRTIAFGGRKFTENDNGPKYINSPDSMVYNKSSVLFGFSRAKREIAVKNYVIVVEGYADLIAMAEFGVNNTVAPCGTAFTQEQANMLKRNTENVILMYDGDEAGINAAERGLEITLKAGLNTKIVTLPEGDDPDSFLRSRGVGAFKKIVKDAKGFIDFIIDKNKLKIAEPHGKAEIARKITHIIYQIPDKFTHDDFMQILGTRLSLSINQIKQLYKAKNNDTPDKQYHQEVKTAIVSGQNTEYSQLRKEKVIICEAIHKLPEDVIYELYLSELNILKVLLLDSNSLDLIENTHNIHNEHFHSITGKNIFSIIYEYAYDRKNIIKDIIDDDEVDDYYRNIILAIALPSDEIHADWIKYGSDKMVYETDSIINNAFMQIIKYNLLQRRERLSQKLNEFPDEDLIRAILSRMVKLDKILSKNELLKYKEFILTDDMTEAGL